MYTIPCTRQNITAECDIEKMILGNKCDLAELRVISTEKGKTVSLYNIIYTHAFISDIHDRCDNNIIV